MNFHIFLFEDEKDLRADIKESISMDGVSVYDFASWNDYNANEYAVVPDLAILDIGLPDSCGLFVFKELKQKYPRMEGIIITGQPNFNNAVSSLKVGAIDYLEKPFRADDLRGAIKICESYKQFLLNRKFSEKQLLDSKKIFKQEWGIDFIGKSPAIKKINSIMCNVAMADSLTVMITGESGSGKELVARGIHCLSERRNKKFYPVNCTAIPETLFESEFFGYQKGSFTGALKDKEGWFEKAKGGTLFLDEIGDLNLLLQAKLLRVLDNNKVYRIGSHDAVHVDVRVICATNRNLKLMVEEGTFRMDLYHRLNSFALRVPSLRERKEDISILANHFLKLYAIKYRRRVKRIHSKAIKLLESYHYPGNVRELRNVIERAVVVTVGETIDSSCLSFGESEQQNCPITNNLNLDCIEKETILKAMQISRYNKTLAAKKLNITRQALNRKLKKYNIE